MGSNTIAMAHVTGERKEIPASDLTQCDIY